MTHKFHGISGSLHPDPVAQLVRSRDRVRKVHPPVEPGLPTGVAERGHVGVHEVDVGSGGGAGFGPGAEIKLSKSANSYSSNHIS